METQDQSQAEVDCEQDMDADMEEIWTGIVSTRRENVASSSVHTEVFPILFLGRTPQVGDVPHPNRGHQRDSTVNDPVILDKSRLGPAPEIKSEPGGDTGKHRVGEGCQPDLSPSNLGLHLRAMNPAWNIDQIVSEDDYKLQDYEARKERGHDGPPVSRGTCDSNR
jgi:hypothetical protein